MPDEKFTVQKFKEKLVAYKKWADHLKKKYRNLYFEPFKWDNEDFFTTKKMSDEIDIMEQELGLTRKERLTLDEEVGIKHITIEE